METPTLSASKLRHMPRTPEENSTISSARKARSEQRGREEMGGKKITLDVPQAPDTTDTVTDTCDTE
jgi:hypothetical protein